MSDFGVRLRSYGFVVLGSVALLGGVAFFSSDSASYAETSMSSGSGMSVGTGVVYRSTGTSYQNHMRHGGYDPRKIAKQFPNRRVVPGEVHFDWSSRRLDSIFCDDVEKSDLGSRLYRIKYSQRSVGECVPAHQRAVPYKPMIY